MIWNCFFFFIMKNNLNYFNKASPDLPLAKELESLDLKVMELEKKTFTLG